MAEIDDIRNELRRAIIFSCFHGTTERIDGRKYLEAVMHQKAAGFAEFGVAAKIFTADEGNDWLDAIWGRKSIGEVNKKYPLPEQSE